MFIPLVRQSLFFLLLYAALVVGSEAIAASGPDPLYRKQTALHYARFDEAMPILLDDKTQAHAPIIVGVIDKGSISANHEDLSGVILPESETTSNDRFETHGQYVTGVLAARGDNGVGIRGAISSHVKILYLQVHSADDIAFALQKLAARGASVVNISLGLNAHCAHSTANDHKCQEPVMEIRRVAQAARKVMRDSNMMIVTSAGNDNIYISPLGIESDGLIVVGAMNSNGRVASYSNYGPGVSLYAPDFGVWGLTHSGYTLNEPATSFTTPIVSGAVAWAALYLKAHGVKYSTQELKNLILLSLRSQPGLSGKAEVGGSLDLLNLAQRLKSYVETSPHLPTPIFKSLSPKSRQKSPSTGHKSGKKHPRRH